MSLKKTIVVPAVFLGLFGGTLVSHDAAAVGGKLCEAHRIKMSTQQFANEAEFLFKTKADYDKVNKTRNNTGWKAVESLGIYGYECDTGACGNEAIAVLPAGHVFAGNQINEAKAYQCAAGTWTQDKWSAVDCSNTIWIDCASAGIKNAKRCQISCRGVITVATCADGYTQTDDLKKCIEESNKVSCVEGEATPCTEAQKQQGAISCQKHKVALYRCEPVIVDCDSKHDLFVFDKDETKNVCRPKSNPDKASCRQKHASEGAERLACCDVPSAESWWSGQHCICTSDAKSHTPDPNKKFVIDNNGRGACVAVNPGPNPNPNPVVVDPCACKSTVNVQALASAKAKCGNVSAVAQIILNIETECAKESACNVNTFNANMTALTTAVNADNCGVRPDYDVTKITNAVTSIDKRVAGFDTSVWKNAEGKFNTARLASDSIAGVVLGTVGGVVTGVVVKKNQVKKGFEDISCTVGGQVVGGYGDEIRVGMQ